MELDEVIPVPTAQGDVAIAQAIVAQMVILDRRVEIPRAVTLRHEVQRGAGLQLSRENGQSRTARSAVKFLVEIFTDEVDVGRQRNGERDAGELVGRLDADREVVALVGSR